MNLDHFVSEVEQKATLQLGLWEGDHQKKPRFLVNFIKGHISPEPRTNSGLKGRLVFYLGFIRD